MASPDTIYAKSYGSLVANLAQQKGSKLRNTVMIKSGVNAEETYMDQLAAFTVRTKGARGSETDPEALNVSRRRIALEDKFSAKFIDKSDDIRTLADPTSATVMAGMWGLGRQIDQTIYDAARGTAYTGKVGGTSVALPSGQKVAVGSTNMTIDKWLAAKEILDGNDYSEEGRVLVIGSSALASLLDETEIKSADYNSIKALVRGEINSFLGFQVIRVSDTILTSVSTTQYLIAFARQAMGLAIGQDIVSKIDLLPQNHYMKQLYFSMSLGASRLEEEGVVEIAINTSA